MSDKTPQEPLSKEPQIPPLIVDTDIEFIGSLQRDSRASELPPLTAATREAALAIIESDKLVSSVFVNAKAAKPLALPIVRACTLRRPNTPIFLILDSRSLEVPEAELNNASIQRVLYKPLAYTEILKIATLAELTFDPSKAIKIASENVDKLDQEVSADDDNYRPIRAATFIAGKSSFFDLYVKIHDGRYVKILQANDVFSPERLKAYLAKGVQQFYIRLEAQEHYLKYCDKLTAALLKTTSASEEVRVSQTLNQGQETLSYLRNNGVNEKLLQYSERFAQNLATLVQQINFPENTMLTKFLSDIASHEHGVSTSILASMLAKSLNFEAEKSVHIVGLASLLHDIALVDMDEKFRKEDEQKFSPDELKLYQQHPTKSVEMLKAMKGIEPGVLQAIEQHHERRNRGGFPNRLGSNQINRIAEFVGISEEFLRLVDRVKAGELKRHPVIEMEISIFDGFSMPVVDAFKDIFSPTKKQKKFKS